MLVGTDPRRHQDRAGLVDSGAGGVAVPQPKETKERGVNEYYILDGHEPVPASKEEWKLG